MVNDSIGRRGNCRGDGVLSSFPGDTSSDQQLCSVLSSSPRQSKVMIGTVRTEMEESLQSSLIC